MSDDGRLSESLLSPLLLTDSAGLAGSILAAEFCEMDDVGICDVFVELDTLL